MTTGVDSAGDRNSSVNDVGGGAGVDAARDVEAKSELTSAAADVSDADADRVAAEVVGDVDTVERVGGPAGGPASVDGAAKVDGAETPEVTEVPSTEPSPENRAKAEEFRERLHAADELEAYEAQTERARTLDDIAAHAKGIEDPTERDNFVRAIATDAGAAAGKYANTSPYGATAKLEAIGEGVSADTGRLLARGALSTPGGQDSMIAISRGDGPVQSAFGEARSGRLDALGEVASGVARTVIPGVDATVRALDGDYEGAAGSAALDLAGGAIIRGGKYAIGAVAGGAALAPETAEAGVLSRLTLGAGKDAVEFTATKHLVKGRTPAHDVHVPVTFKDGTSDTLRLFDPRAKHNMLGSFDSNSLSRTAKAINKGKAPNLAPARSEGQFVGRYNTPQGQAELGRLVAERLSPDQLRAVQNGGTGPIVKLDREVGFTPINGQVRVATSVRILGNGDGGFHLVPMP